MYTDPAVVRRKVERELQDYADRQGHYRARGIWILHYQFPELLVAFVTPKIKPFPTVPYGVLFELSNYDIEPPSLRFVDPLTLVPLKRREIATSLIRRRAGVGLPAGIVVPPAQPNPLVGSPVAAIDEALLQYWTLEDDRPFVCLQGVREYHDNPGHTGDSWWLHRGKQAGSILRLMDVLSRYGTEAMTQQLFNINIVPVGFQGEPPVEASA
jgi:hypothetical protein